jgi:hypothetical protein
VDTTHALDSTSATRAMPRTSYESAPAYSEPTAPPPPARDGRAARKAARRRQLATFFALLLVLAAIAAVGVALVASSDNGSGVSPVNENDVQQQIDGTHQLIQDNTKR